MSNIVKVLLLPDVNDNDNDNDNVFDENENHKENISKDLESISMLTLIKQSRILEYVIPLLKDSRMTQQVTQSVLYIFTAFSAGNDECVEYMLNIGMLDCLQICFGLGCPDNTHTDKSKCCKCNILSHSCHIVSNISCGTKSQCQRLLNRSNFHVCSKLISIILNRKHNQMQLEASYAISNIVVGVTEHNFDKIMDNLVLKLNVINVFDKMLDSKDETTLRLAMESIRHILSVGKYYNSVKNGGVIPKVMFFQHLFFSYI